jgi:hypothetical protein
MLPRFPPIIRSLPDLEHANAELRAALRIAAKRIRQLNFGRREDPVLDLLRTVWRETVRYGPPPPQTDSGFGREPVKQQIPSRNSAFWPGFDRTSSSDQISVFK